ncbi:MAG: hypothetical protein ACK2U5_04850 [Candidatus Promineifilaceae bacterium]|jgi:hypothetical protein
MDDNKLTFYTYRRSAAANGAKPAKNQRLKGEFKLTLQETQGGHPPETADVDFLLMGPLDAKGLKPGAVRRTYPAHGAFNVDTDKCPYVEFAAEDLPWRYSPEANSDEMEPWLLLVVGTREEVTLLSGGRVVLSQGLVNAYTDDPDNNGLDLYKKGFRWAHVQKKDGVTIGRLLSPRGLKPSQSYVAAIIPAYESGVFDLRAGTPIPAYYFWKFATSDTEQSFVDLAKRLKPLTPKKAVGQAPVAYQTSSGQASVTPWMLVGGALTGLEAAPPVPVPDGVLEEIQDHFMAIRPTTDPKYQRDKDGRPLVRLPLYGEPWLKPGDDEPAWMRELNDDPRHRGVAGLGMWAGIEWQEHIVDAAASQLGAFYSAARHIRGLTAGLAAARSLWEHRLPRERNQRLQLLGLALGRMAAAAGGSALEHVSADGRTLPPAFFSSAARRLLRPGTARARLAKEGALDPQSLFESMNRCPPDKREHPANLPHTAHFSGGMVDEAIAALVAEGVLFHYSGVAYEESFEFLHKEEQREYEELGFEEELGWDNPVTEPEERRREMQEAAYNPYPERPCATRFANLDALDALLDQAISPRGDGSFMVRRVLSRIEGLDDQPLTPPELCLDFHIPAWKFLKEYAEEWFLPGLGQLQLETVDGEGHIVVDSEKDPVIPARTNAYFSDAFLVGFNQQALAELRWRNIPVAAGCTPLRRFWEPLGRNPHNGQMEASEDIRGLHAWGDTPLGDAGHEAPAAVGENLVLIFKSQIWRRYPETLVYLLPEDPLSDRQPKDPNWQAVHIEPNLHVEIGPDIVAFGFPQVDALLDAQGKITLNKHWVVIEQVPRGINFYNVNKLEGQAAMNMINGNSAQFADIAFAPPVRVLIHGSQF